MRLGLTFMKTKRSATTKVLNTASYARTVYLKTVKYHLAITILNQAV